MTEIELLGRSLRLNDIPLAWTTYLRRTWLQPRNALSAHPYEIRLERSDPRPRPAGAVARDATQHQQRANVWATPQGWWWGDDRTGMQTCFGEAHASIWVWGFPSTATSKDTSKDTSEDARTETFASLLLLALHEALRASGLFPLHAAAAIAPGDVAATVFLGPSGRGKTTTLLRAMSAGWAPVCEDMGWLEPTTLTLYGWDHGPNLLPDTLQRFVPSLAERLPLSTGDPVRRKVQLSHTQLAERFGVSWRPSAPLGRIVALERGTRGWQPLSRLEGVPLLWEATGLSLQPWMRQQTAAQIAALSRRAVLARLELDADFDNLELFR